MARILIIDDSTDVRMRLRGILTRAGHEVIEGVDGSNGLELLLSNQLSNQRLDLAISDFFMPGYDGLSMLKKAKERLGEFGFPVFMLTTETNTMMKESAKQLGVVAWIIKPVVEDRLLRAIDKVLVRAA